MVSCKTSAKNILKLKPNGIFLSNGPGDPAVTGKYAIEIIKDLIKEEKQSISSCFSNQESYPFWIQSYGDFLWNYLKNINQLYFL